jgi:hypothetical protein
MRSQGILCSGTKRQMAPCEIHLRMPSRVLFLTPAIKAVSSTMQLKTLRLGGSGARMAAVLAVARGGCGLPRMVVGGVGLEKGVMGL